MTIKVNDYVIEIRAMDLSKGEKRFNVKTTEYVLNMLGVYAMAAGEFFNIECHNKEEAAKAWRIKSDIYAELESRGFYNK